MASRQQSQSGIESERPQSLKGNVQIQGAFECLSSEYRELYPSCIEEMIDPPDPLVFHQKYVSQNRPLLIKKAVNHWPALTTWKHDYFREKIGKTEVTVTVTPNGYADAICDGRFVMPEERTMTMNEFIDIMDEDVDDRKEKGVFYIQKQNSNLRDEFSTLLEDVDFDISWGTKAFGCEPDAVNFWMGDEMAVTSMHRDHYENLYVVVSGEKHFILLPPTDLPYIPYESHPPADYVFNPDGSSSIVDSEDKQMVSWIAIDPLNPDTKRYPQYKKARPISITVKAGEMLYLPSLWFHHVRQSQGCIAVNYWYDMVFDIKWAYYQLLQRLSPSSS